MPIDVFVVDRRELLHAGFRHYCENHTDLNLVGCASSFSQEQFRNLSSTVDVLVIDQRLIPAGETSIDTLFENCDSLAQCRVLTLSEEDCIDQSLELIHFGASGYLSHESSLSEIGFAIKSVNNGQILITHSRKNFSRSRRAKERKISSRPTVQSGVKMSQREQEVLKLVGSGMTNKQAAAKLFLSVKTVETYRSRLMKKFALKDRVDLIQFARELGETSHTNQPVVAAG